MAEMTSRDRVWNYTLVRCVRHGKTAKPGDIADIADVSERMARDCLLVMADTGWLERNVKQNGEVEYMCKEGVEAPESDVL